LIFNIQPTIKSVLQTKEVVEKCDLALAKWFIDASIPFNAANSLYFQFAVDALVAWEPDIKFLLYMIYMVLY